ncbi:hypothetical protein CBR_g40664 [Chara braunii]|uniref:Uncharacterized protein n=1 Tax=Chara braunii TaxID=69332 RepID=A0A388LUD8_CHABU|nr:hypothetical protein CBR_g40664 [Chara braunii]|eukprot:GBG85853.1 hypothetical protein CBR_g40664 [Chara braunii]
MLDCQAGIELEPVHTGTRKGMTQEEIAQQVVLITIGASAPPPATAVFERRGYIFRLYPRDDDSDDERIPEAADDPGLPIHREIDDSHKDPKDAETRTYTARRGRDFDEMEMMGENEDRWGPISPSPVSPLQMPAIEVETQELASSLPQHGPLHRSTVIRWLRLPSPSPRVLQEEVGHRATPKDMGRPVVPEVEVTAAPPVEAKVTGAEEEVQATAAGKEEVRARVVVVG